MIRAPCFLDTPYQQIIQGGYRFEKVRQSTTATAVWQCWKKEMADHGRASAQHNGHVLSAGKRRSRHTNRMGAGQNHYAGHLQQDPRHLHHCRDCRRFRRPAAHELQQKRSDGR